MKFVRTLLLVAILFLIYPDHAAAQQDKQENSAAIETLIKAAEQGDAKSQCELAKSYLEGRRYAEAVKWFRKAADQGSAEAQGWIGALYDAGLGVTRNYIEAAKWYRKAAEQGDVWAQLNLGFMYDQGRNVSKPPPALNGEPQIFNFGDGGGFVKKDYAEAAKWYREAAEQGSGSAQSRLGWMHLEGRGVNKNSAEAERWLRMAAEQGDVSSQCILGAIYADDKAVPQDYVQAYMWLNLCTLATQGEKQEMAIKLQEEIAKRMTPQQMAEAKRLADEFDIRNVKTKGKGLYIADIGMEATGPVVLVGPMPSYTDAARQEHVSGIVLMQCIVRKDGTADSFKILRGLGYGLDESAVSTIAIRWRFKPGAFEGEPVDVKIMMDTTFRLY